MEKVCQNKGSGHIVLLLGLPRNSQQCKKYDNNNNIANSPPVNYNQPKQISAIPKGYVDVDVYVGNSSKGCVITYQYINHPLLSVLIQKSGGGDHGYLAIGCEVVLFENLLWTL